MEKKKQSSYPKEKLRQFSLIIHNCKYLRKTPFAIKMWLFHSLKLCLVIVPSFQMEVQLFGFKPYKIIGLSFLKDVLSSYLFHKFSQCTLIRYNSAYPGKSIVFKLNIDKFMLIPAVITIK